MGSADSELVDVWIVGFDVPLPQATEGIAAVFGVDPDRAAALVASVPRGVRRGLDPGAAQESVAALTSIGARVRVLPSGERPVAAAPVPAAASPRVTLKRAARTAWLEEEEPAYGVGSAAYVPRAQAQPPSERADEPMSAAPEEHSLLGVDTSPGGASALGVGTQDDFFDDDLQLGSLIPAPLSEAALVDARRELELQLASLPKVQAPATNPSMVGPEVSKAPRGRRASVANDARRAPVAEGARRTQPDGAEPSKPASGSRVLLAVAAGALVLMLALLVWRSSSDAPSEHLDDASPAANANAGPSDADLLAACAGYVMVEARTWVHLGELNHFGTMDPASTRAFLARLSTAGALTASVAVQSEMASQAGYLLLQHTPFHVDTLMQAATSDASGAVVPASCVQTSPRYMLIRLTDCPP